MNQPVPLLNGSMTDSWTTWVTGLASAVPLVFAGAAVAVGQGDGAAGRRGVIGAALGGVTVLAVVAAWVLGGGGPVRGALPVRVDAVTVAALGLVALLAFVLARYTRTFLRGEPGQARATRWLLATVVAVAVLVVANHLVVVLLGWTAAGLALHRLLTFYAARPQALVAAHKKFLASRAADLLLLGAATLWAVEAGSLDLDGLAAWADAQATLPLGAQVAAVLLVLGVALKSAQLPVHGWLLQVMEAPTPVSALLHAGVVNVGGLVMVRLAPVMAKAPVAQGLLVAIGTATAVVAGLVMMTRVSVKVALAWSTCAQLGFMLVQCGLGAWHLALLHLLAHSLYKAHAFLAAGSTVDVARVAALSTPAPRVSFARWVGVGVAGGVAVVAGAWALGGSGSAAALALATALGLSTTVARGTAGGPARALAAVLAAGAVAGLSVAWHAAFAAWLVAPPAPASTFALAVATGGFLLLFLAQGALQASPDGALVRALYPRLFAGLFLDERFTRLTFKWWPPRLPARAAAPPLRVPETLEA